MTVLNKWNYDFYVPAVALAFPSRFVRESKNDERLPSKLALLLSPAGHPMIAANDAIHMGIVEWRDTVLEAGWIQDRKAPLPMSPCPELDTAGLRISDRVLVRMEVLEKDDPQIGLHHVVDVVYETEKGKKFPNMFIYRLNESMERPRASDGGILEPSFYYDYLEKAKYPERKYLSKKNAHVQPAWSMNVALGYMRDYLMPKVFGAPEFSLHGEYITMRSAYQGNQGWDVMAYGVFMGRNHWDEGVYEEAFQF